MFTVVVDRPGDTALELTPVAESCQWDSAAVGGYGSCSFTLPGLLTRRQLPYLATIRLYYGTAQLWEGRIEDIALNVVDNQTKAQAFGWKRALDFGSARKTWVSRSYEWQADKAGVGDGTAWPFNNAAAALPWTDNLEVVTGEIDATDATKKGVRIAGKGVAVPSLAGAGAYIRIPNTTALVTTGAYIAFTVAFHGSWATVMGSGGANGIRIFGWTWGSTSGISSHGLSAGSGVDAFINSQSAIALLGKNESGGSATPAAADWVDITNIRVLFKQTEDASGGYYGDTLINDVLSFVPDIAAGTIESGSDFLIQDLDRPTRDTARAIIDEIASYYAREWAVWEAGRFDWKAPNLDEPQYIASIGDCTRLEITGSLDTLVGTSYVLYTDAQSGIDAEASAAATSQRNPFVRTGTARHDLTQVSFPMTANTAAQLAARIAIERGTYPPVTGTIVLPARKLITDATGTAVPAFQIRAGRNILLPDLPRDEVFTQGQDGQTLFHIATCETNMADGTVTLELEGQGRQLDAILARLASVTKVLTG